MSHFIAYHNAEKMDYSYEQADPFSVGTAKSVKHLIGKRVWTITGNGRPRVYHLRDTWIVNECGPSEQEEFVNYARGVGDVFDPPVLLNPLKWFPEFLKSQSNFSLGLQPITDAFAAEFELIWSAQPTTDVSRSGRSDQITSAKLMRFATTVEGQRLMTPGRGATFIVRVRADGIEITPESTGEPRLMSWVRLDRVCDRYQKTRSQKPSDYRSDTFHASYALALIRLSQAAHGATYPDWKPGTRPTDPTARVCRFRNVKNVRAVRIENGSFRDAPVSGVFELYETERDRPIEEQPSGKRFVKVICAWHGGQPNSGASGARINLSGPGARAEILEHYSGAVVDNIGHPDDHTPVDTTLPEFQVQRTSAAPIPEFSAEEGRELLKRHKQRERHRGLVTRKKHRVLADKGCLMCEVCDFDFEVVYGRQGNGFAECHHRLPLASGSGIRRTRLSDLSIVCANCHRMLHRRPWHSVEELRTLVLTRRGP